MPPRHIYEDVLMHIYIYIYIYIYIHKKLQGQSRSIYPFDINFKKLLKPQSSPSKYYAWNFIYLRILCTFQNSLQSLFRIIISCLIKLSLILATVFCFNFGKKSGLKESLEIWVMECFTKNPVQVSYTQLSWPKMKKRKDWRGGKNKTKKYTRGVKYEFIVPGTRSRWC